MRRKSGLSPALFIASGFMGGLAVPDVPVLTAPENAAVLDDTTPDFSWQAVPGAATYDIEIRAALTGTPTATGIATNSYTPGSALDAGTTYSWRVRAVNAVGAGAWSATRTFSFDYATYITNVVTPVLWRRYRETGGGSPVNSGSAPLTIAQSNITQGQTGADGVANEAHAWNGTTSYERITDDNTLDMASFTALMLIKADNAGESDAGRFFTHGTEFLRFANSTMTLSSIVDTDATDAVSVTTTQLTPGTWYWLAMTFDNTAAGANRIIRIYVNGVEAAYSGTPTAATGNRVVASTDFFIGNNSMSAANTYSGLMDEFILCSPLTPIQLLKIAALKPPNF